MDLILEAKVVALKNYKDGNTVTNEGENNDSSSKKA